MIYRQGDVLLKSISKLPKSAKSVKSENGKFVLAHGEVTNHAHTVCELDGALFIGEGNQLFLKTDAGCDLLHQEHGPITVDPGIYEVIRQREYSPEEIRRVAD